MMTVTGNAMIVDVMLEVPPSNLGNTQAGVQYAQQNFNTWKAIVNAFADNNQIKWNQIMSFASLGSNCTYLENGRTLPGVTDSLTIRGSLYFDALAYCNHPPDDSHYMEFVNTDGTNVRINLLCGNITGAVATLHPPNPPSAFTITTTPTVDIGDTESPNPATFTVNARSSRAPVNNVHIITNYYVNRYGGGRVSLAPSGDNYPRNFPSTGTITMSRSNVNLPSLNAGDQVCMSTYASPGTGQVDLTTGNVVSGSDTAPVESCKTIVNKPYVRSVGADTFAGTSAGCALSGWPASNNSGGIYGYSSGPSNASKGSGAQLALLSLYNIIGYRSGVMQTVPALSSATAVGNPLHFANTPVGSFTLPLGYTSQGGKFNTSHCPVNYAGVANTQTTASPSPPASLGAGTNGSFRHPGPTFVLNGGTGLTGRILIYVTGNVVINGNITYQTAGWTGPDTTPSLTIVATGNIYIGSGVTQLDGVFIAQNSATPSPANGTIYTCSTNTTPANNANAFGLCNKQLTVNGALISDRLKLLRTYGSLRNSGTTDDSPYGGAKACTNNGLGAVSPGSCAAEVINFRPEIYLTNPVLGNSGSADPHVDYIVSPSPLL